MVVRPQSLLPTVMNPADTPILLIPWRYSHSLCLVIDAIRQVAPKRL